MPPDRRPRFPRRRGRGRADRRPGGRGPGTAHRARTRGVPAVPDRRAGRPSLRPGHHRGQPDRGSQRHPADRTHLPRSRCGAAVEAGRGRGRRCPGGRRAAAQPVEPAYARADRAAPRGAAAPDRGRPAGRSLSRLRRPPADRAGLPRLVPLPHLRGRGRRSGAQTETDRPHRAQPGRAAGALLPRAVRRGRRPFHRPRRVGAPRAAADPARRRLRQGRRTHPRAARTHPRRPGPRLRPHQRTPHGQLAAGTVPAHLRVPPRSPCARVATLHYTWNGRHRRLVSV